MSISPSNTNNFAFDFEKIRPCLSANFINGVCVNGEGDEIEVFRPSDGLILSPLHCANIDQLSFAIENAQMAQKNSSWSNSDPRKRMKILRNWADLIESDIELLAPLEAVGSTRNLSEIIAWDIPYSAECIRFFAEFADKIGGEVASTSHQKMGFIINEPYGVIGAIAPWNLPLVMAIWKIAPALAAGNAVVLKPSELTPFSIVRLAELAIKAGMPPGIFNIVQGTGAIIGDALVRHELISKVSFTGSTFTGKLIMSACAQSGPKPVTLELGGKSPQIIFADAQIDKACTIVARAITLNSGQVCVSGSRLLVDEKIKDEVTSRILEKFNALKLGATWDNSNTMGPIVSKKQLENITNLVTRAKNQGAEIIYGGKNPENIENGTYFEPTLIDGVNQDDDIVQSEVFGPVLTLQSFASEEEAFDLANRTKFGLAAGVHTNNISLGMQAIRKLEAGTIWVNRYGRSDDFIMPTGGYKQSGIGKDLGREAYLGSCKSKAALIDL